MALTKKIIQDFNRVYAPVAASSIPHQMMPDLSSGMVSGETGDGIGIENVDEIGDAAGNIGG